MTNLHRNIVTPDFYTKVDIHQYFALLTLKTDEFAPKHGYSWFTYKSWHSAIPWNLDFKKWGICTKTWLFLTCLQNLTFIHTLKSDEFAPNHGYSLLTYKSWHSSMFCTFDYKNWLICTKTWLFLISIEKLTSIHTLQFRLEKVTNLQQNMVIPNLHTKVDIHPYFAI